jgi:hypothetical protein
MFSIQAGIAASRDRIKRNRSDPFFLHIAHIRIPEDPLISWRHEARILTPVVFHSRIPLQRILTAGHHAPNRPVEIVRMFDSRNWLPPNFLQVFSRVCLSLSGLLPLSWLHHILSVYRQRIKTLLVLFSTSSMGRAFLSFYPSLGRSFPILTSILLFAFLTPFQ